LSLLFLSLLSIKDLPLCYGIERFICAYPHKDKRKRRNKHTVEKRPYYTFPGATKHNIMIMPDNEKILRQVAPKKGEMSKLINDLITEKYALKVTDSVQHT
jgi:hypothetical protein